MNNATCFSTEELRRYLLGDLPDETSDAVALHVDECTSCESTVSLLDRESDTLIQSLRDPVAQDEPASAYRLAAKLAKSKWQDSSPDLAVESLSKVPKLRDYELLEPLARGGMGTVYRARHTRLNRQVALKVLPGRWLKSPAAVARFEREMHAVGSLKHPAIVQATDGGEADGVHFLVMELIEGFDGGSLAQLLGPLPIADACEIARQAADGMAYVHRQGIIHRDLKPSNLMVTRSGEVKVLDLGLARLVDEQLTGDELTTIGQLMGTLDYMSPEQLENSHDVDARADLYSLGATLYKLLTGHSPHTSDFSEPFLSKIRRIASEKSMPLKERREDVPHELCELVDRLLSRGAEDRPASMESVGESLTAFSGNSNLARRMKEATKRRKQRATEGPTNDLGATSARETGATRLRPVATPDGLRRFLAWAVALLLLIATGMAAVIALETTAGRLVIETATPDVEVRILKAGKPYRQLTLSHKPKSLTLRAGEYRIEIVSDADGLDVQNGQYTLKHGDTWLAKIVHREKQNDLPIADGPGPGYPTATPVELPTYEGKTLAQWLTLLRTERSGSQVYEACKALGKLGSDDDTETVDALLHAVRYHTSGSYHKIGDAGAVRIWDSVQQVLSAQDQHVVVSALAKSLARDDDSDRSFILEYIADHADHLRPIATDRLLDQVRRIAADPESAGHVAGLRAFRAIGSKEAASRLLVTALDDPQAMVTLFAANTLIEMKINTTDVVSALRRVVLSADLRSRAEAAWRLGDLGSEAQSAVPELLKCVEDQDLSVTLAGVYRSPNRTSSVKDAAVRSLGQIGDDSVTPVLIDEWNRRALGGRPTIKPGSLWQQQHGIANTYNPDWVADAIEKLIGRRPDAERRPDRTYATVWSTNGLSVDQVYRAGFDSRYRRNTEGLIEAAEQLLPISQPFERELACTRVKEADRIPDEEELELEVRLIEQLALSQDPKTVLKSLYARRSDYLSIIEKQANSEKQTKTIQEYRELANRILQGQENWKSTCIPFLIELLDQRYPGAAVSFLDLIGDFEADQQTEGVVKIFYLIRGLGVGGLEDATSELQSWTKIPANRAAIQKHLREDRSRSWRDLVTGIYRWGGDDDLANESVKERFAEDSINRVNLINDLIVTMNDQPKLSELIIDLIQHPAMDEAATVMRSSNGKTTETSMRASYVAQLLPAISEQHRSRFLPMLKQLAESGSNGEPAAANQLLDQWK